VPDLADLYPGFAAHWIDTSAGRIFARSGGEGPPLLLLHGYPQTKRFTNKINNISLQGLARVSRAF